MQPLYGTDTHESTYRMPAHWGSLVLTTAFDSLWSIEAELNAVAEPDAAPEFVIAWMQRLENMISSPAPLSQDVLDLLLDSPRLQGASNLTRKVLGAVATIPPGNFRTYAEIALACGNPNAARAVGRILAANPFIVLIACHRVVAADRIRRMDITEPQTLMPVAYCGRKELAPVAAWLRLNDMASAV